MKKTILTLFALSLAAATPHLVHGWFNPVGGPSDSSSTSESAMHTGQDHELKKQDHDQNQEHRTGQPAEYRMIPKPATAVPAR